MQLSGKSFVRSWIQSIASERETYNPSFSGERHRAILAQVQPRQKVSKTVSQKQARHVDACL
jgi:hypothetical protein